MSRKRPQRRSTESTRPKTRGDQALHDWRPVFLRTFGKTGNVTESCRAAGIHRSTPYLERKLNEAFAAEWDSVTQEAIDTLEAEARRRAMSTSDVLLIFLLKALKPEMYRERVDVKIDVDREAARIAEELGLDPREVVAEAERVVAEARFRQGATTEG